MSVPATAGPTQSSFADSPVSVQQTRMNAAATLRARAINRENSPTSEDQQVPMSAALGGKFGSRGVVGSGASPLNPHAAAFVGRFNPEPINTAVGVTDQPQTPTHTTVISGGTLLGGLGNSGSTTPNPSYNGLSGYNNAVGPSKSDTALSWRRGSATSTPNGSKPPSPPLGANRAVSASPASGIGPLGRLVTSNSNLSSVGSDSPGPSPLRTRPQPLRFNLPISNGAVAISDRNSDNGDAPYGDNASGSAKSDSPVESSPPTSAGSREREEASKRLYEGLGIGRPQQSPSATTTSFNLNSAAPVFKPQQAYPARSMSLNTTTQVPTLTMTGPTPVTATGPANLSAPRLFSVPIRQPRGPPSGVEELGARNFASRMRKKALGGLGALMDARAERENVAAGLENGSPELGLEEVVAY
ncbi:hypothetical protein FRC03_007185 [Tulasnella sp. 419]|nr:hypothetical protein FRC03_007185 [Tulasnella sp. 419]